MGIKVNAFPDMMGLISITAFILSAIKYVLLVYLIIKGIQAANIYINNNKDKREE